MGNLDLVNIYAVLAFGVVIADFITAIHCVAERKKYSFILSIVSISVAFVQIFYTVSLYITSYFWHSLFTSLYYIMIDFGLLTLLTFIRTYSDTERNSFNKVFKCSFSVIFIIDALLYAINPFKELVISFVDLGGPVARFYPDKMTYYAIHSIYVLMIVIVILYHLIRRANKIPQEYRRQYFFVVYHMLGVTVISSLISLFSYVNRPILDYSIIMYSAAVFSVYQNFFRYPVKGMRSYYNEWIVENVNQGVVLFNFEGDLIICNEKVKNIFPNANIKNYMKYEEFLNELSLKLYSDRRNENYSFQHYISRDGKAVAVRFDHRSLINKNDEMLGELFVFTDESADVDILTSFYTWEKFKQLLNDEPEVFKPPMVVSVFDINGLGEINTKHGKNAGDQAIELLSNLIRKYYDGASYFVRGQEASLIVLSYDIFEEDSKEKIESIIEELKNNKNLEYPIYIQSAVSVIDNNNSVLGVVKQTLKGMNNKKLLDIKSRRSELVMSLVKTLAECDDDTEAHVRRTQTLGEALGKRLGLSDVELSDLALLCILHDIGKIGIPLEILNKPARLSDSEWRMMRTHTSKGYQIATSSQELEHLAGMILHHHEWWNGKGYPDGLKGDEIPLLSRVISVVDAYDAMTNDRIYRPAKSVEDAVKELKRCAGTQFDPTIVNTFARMLPEVGEIDDTEGLDLLSASKGNAESESTDAFESKSSNISKSNVHKVNYCRYVLDNKLRVVEIDSVFEELTGYSSDDIKNSVITQSDLLPEEDRTEYMQLVSEQLQKNNLAYFEHRIKRKDGSIIFVFCYGKVYYDSAEMSERSEIIVFDSTDTHAMKVMISEEQHKAEQKLAEWADKSRCDSLTGLLNHEAFKGDIDSIINDSDSKIMFLMMDVDKFKQYNDTFGHMAGDEFLIMLAQNLTSTLRKDDLACRMGGDEFAAALIYKNSVSDKVMLDRASQICDKINMILSTYEGGTSLSMGVSIASNSINTFNKLYETSDKALYEAKASGRARLVVYEGEN